MNKGLLLLLVIISAVCWGPVSIADANSHAPGYAGHYQILVRGFWNGEGDANVGAGSVQINATVQDDAGQSGKLVTGSLAVVNNHFSGTGTLAGATVNVEGRLDADDSAPKGKGKGKGKAIGHDDPVLTNARVCATVVTAGHAARVVGGRD